ncbi:MAG: hypothetical protein INR70_39460 [Parafilimonas terrae]|nr:hypothetical protein [Parafilimonas terrae]
MVRSALSRSFACLLCFSIPEIAAAQDNPAGDRPPTAGSATQTSAEPGRNGESAPRRPEAKGTTDVSPGVGTVEGADGKPPIPNRPGK